MTAGINTYSNISTFVNTIFEDALAVARDSVIAPSLVTVFTDRQGMAARKNQQYAAATINAVGEADDLVSQAFTPTALSTLTPAEYGAQFLLTDQRLESDPFGVRQDAALELGAALGQDINSKVFSNFSSLTGGTVGASGTALTWGYFFAMLSRLRAQNAPLSQAAFVCHPYQWHVLGKAVAPGVQTTYNQELGVASNFYVGSVSGVDIYTCTDVTASGTDAYCAMFTPSAIAYDQRRAARLETERDSSRRAWELNLSAVYAHGVWRPAWGIQGIFDASAPTS